MPPADAIARTSTDWVATELVTGADQRPQAVQVPAGAAGPRRRAEVRAATLRHLVREHRDRQDATRRAIGAAASTPTT